MNYYEILKVSKTASQQEIRDSYINLIKQYHPDIYKGSKEYAEKITKELNDAYDVLSVPEKRWEYDVSIEPPKPEYTPPDFNYSAYSPYSKQHKNYNGYNGYSNYNNYREPEPQKDTIDTFMKKHIHKFVDEKMETMSKESKSKLVIVIVFVALIFTLLAINDFIKLQKITELRKEHQKQQKIERNIIEEHKKQLEELEQNYIYRNMI